MKPPPFDYVVPGSVREAVSLLKQYDGEAKLIAGGQSLMPLLNMRLARPAVLIDVNRLKDLDYVREADGALAIGAITRQRTVEKSDLVKSRSPVCLSSADPQPRDVWRFAGACRSVRRVSGHRAGSGCGVPHRRPGWGAQGEGWGLLRHLPDHRAGADRDAHRGSPAIAARPHRMVGAGSLTPSRRFRHGGRRCEYDDERFR
jgi:hypothetical protein